MKDASDAILRGEQAAYLEGLEPPREALLARMEARAKERGYPISDPEVTAFLAILVRSAAPRFLVEVGTNIGYGAIVMARSAPAEARVLTLELSPDLCREARGFIAEANLEGRVQVQQGAALEELARITTPIDLAYVDCVKEEYPQYLELLVPRLAPRGVLVADNVLWKGLVAARDVPEGESKRVAALRRFNEAMMAHPQLRATVLPVGDGLAFAVKLA